MTWPPGSKAERVPKIGAGVIPAIECANGCGMTAKVIAIMWRRGKERVYVCSRCHHQEIRG